jgi:hypothetical protein
MTDWMAMLNEQRKLGDQFAEEIPRTLTTPGLTLDQAAKLYKALEKQAAFMELFVRKLEENSFDPDVILAAEKLEDLFAELAADAAEKTKELSRPGA